MSDYEHGESAREELLSLLNISRETHHNYEELAELAGRCLEEAFEAGRRTLPPEVRAVVESARAAEAFMWALVNRPKLTEPPSYERYKEVRASLNRALSALPPEWRGGGE